VVEKGRSKPGGEAAFRGEIGRKKRSIDGSEHLKFFGPGSGKVINKTHV
jgi:hypothetical protein